MQHHYHRIHPRLRGVRFKSHDVAQFPPGTFTPMQVLQAYGLTRGMFKNVTAVPIGIGSLGGGVVAADITNAVTAWGIARPNVTIHAVGGAANDPVSDQDSNVENMLDIAMVAATISWLTEKPANIIFTIGPNASNGMTLVTQDLVKSGCKVASWSWGSAASEWDPADRASLAAAFAQAVKSGCTFCAAAGDNSIDDSTSAPSADYPCSDPNVWAVGGTKLVTNLDGSYASESAWGDGNPGDEGGGGGFDSSIPEPSWQARIVPAGRGRGVPDSSANADPNSGYQLSANNQWTVVGGTSASSPLTAALFAIAKAADAQTAGLISALLYEERTTAFRDITTGSNGDPATAGWDPCTGNGSPNGAAFFAALGKPAPAPAPPSPSAPKPTAPTTPAGLTLAQAQAIAAQGASQALARNWPVGAK
jgi:kumamolisin